MGMPPCRRKGCENWPGCFYTGLCRECIKVPEYVREVAQKNAEHDEIINKEKTEDSYMLAWLGREPRGTLLRVVHEEMIKTGSDDVRATIEIVRKRYWENGGYL